MRGAPAVFLASVMFGSCLPAGAQDSPGTDVFEAEETPTEAMQRIQKAKQRPVRRGRGDLEMQAPQLVDDSLRTPDADHTTAPSPPDSFPGDRGHGRDNDRGKDLEHEDKGDRGGKGDKDDDRDGGGGDRDDDDDDGDDDKKKGKG